MRTGKKFHSISNRRIPTIRSVRTFKTIDNLDIRILDSIELGMRRFEFVPFEEVLRISKMSRNDLDFHLSNLLKKKLVQTWVGPYKGFSLTEAGYDSLAFQALVKQNVLEAIGPSVGVGKECTCARRLDEFPPFAVPSI